MKSTINQEVRERIKENVCKATEYGYTGRLIFTNDVNEDETYYYIIPTMHNSTIQDTDKLRSIITITKFDKDTNLLEPLESGLFIEDLTREIQRGF